MYFKEVVVEVFGYKYTVKVPCEPSTPIENVKACAIKLVKARLERERQEQIKKSWERFELI